MNRAGAEQAVRDDVDDRSAERDRIETEDREHDQPEVRQRRIRDDAFACRPERAQRARHRPARSDASTNIAGAAPCIGAGNSTLGHDDEAVEARLRLHGADDGDHRRRQVGIGQRHPGVQRPDRRLDQETRTRSPAKIQNAHVGEIGASIAGIRRRSRRSSLARRRTPPSPATTRGRRRDCRRGSATPSPSFACGDHATNVRNTGISIRSQNSANNNRSRATNTPVIAPSSTSICATNSRWRGTRATASAHAVESASSSTIQ